MDSDSKEIPIREQDKNDIVRFNKLLREIGDVQISIDTLDKNIQLLQDASDEVMIADDDEGYIKLGYGDVFVDSTQDFVCDYLDKEIEKEQEKLEKFKEEKETIQTEINTLKKRLYGRFGNTINLD